MKVPQMILAELRRLTATTMARLALIALLTVPILYGGLYLWANQDPYSNLSQVPVALVVQDDGASLNGTQRNLGKEVADELTGSDSFAWHRVDAQAAAEGLKRGDFDFVVTLPNDFSASVASISSSSPHQADIRLDTNDANNYLASTIGTQAVARIRATVAEKVVGEAGVSLLDSLAKIRSNLVDAASGAKQLNDGLTTADGGSAQLSDGSSQLASGTAQLRDGASRLASGTAQLRDGASRLASGTAQVRDGAASLSTGAQQVSNGAGQVYAGTQQLSTVANEIGSASTNAAAQVPAARNDIQTALTDAGVDQATISKVLTRLDPLGQGLEQANGRVQGAVSQINQLNAGAGQVASGASRLAAASVTLAGGARDTATGAASLNDGASSAADGAAQLQQGASSAADGASNLHNGAVSLKDGISRLRDGAGTLQTGLANGVKQIPDNNQATRSAQADILSNPVSVSSEALTKAQNYGAGLAPFFAALAGWIGIYALFLIVKPISRRAVTALRSPVRITIAGWITPTLLGAVQMLGLFGILAFALGFNFAHPVATVGILLTATATYAAIVLALNVWLGSVGQFMGLVLMVLQLVTAGGTFPWQTLPGPLAALHHVLPMGYVVDALRQVMYSGDPGRIGFDLLVLATWLLGAGVLAALGVWRMTRSRTLRDLQPSLIG